MPALEGFLHYRIVDVSSIKELARRWFPRAYFQAPTKRGNHRALADIQESIEELRYYREAVFVARPGSGQRRRSRHRREARRRAHRPAARSAAGVAGRRCERRYRFRGTRLTPLHFSSAPGPLEAAWWV